MSFVIAVSINGVGIVMADTRLNFSYTDGQNKTDDSKELSLSYNEKTTLKWGNRFRKITPVNKFILASTGNATLGRMVLDCVLKTKPVCIEQIQEIIVTKNKEADSLLNKAFSSYNDVDIKSAFIVIEHNNGEIYLRKIDHVGNINHKNVNYVMSFPPEISNGISSHLTSSFENKYPTINSLEDFYSTISLMAEQAHIVYEQSLSVSPEVETVIFTRTSNNNIQTSYLYGVANKIAHTKIHRLHTLNG